MNEISQFLITHGGPVLFLAVLVEQLGAPVPSAAWLLAAGALAAGGKLNPALAIGLATLACLIADSIWFYLGRRSGKRVLSRICRMSLAQDSCVGRSEGLFARHGLLGVFAAKFLPGLGAVMPPLAGAFGVSAGRFLLFDGVGSLLYSGVYVVTGLVFSEQVEQALAVLSRFGLSALAVVAGLIAGYVGFKYVRRLNSNGRKNLLPKIQPEPTLALTPTHSRALSPSLSPIRWDRGAAGSGYGSASAFSASLMSSSGTGTYVGGNDNGHNAAVQQVVGPLPQTVLS